MARPWYEWLERVDRRLIYLVLFVFLSIPFFVTINMKMPIAPATQKVYDAVERLAEYNHTHPDETKIALIVVDWEASTKAECWPITQAVMAHLLRKKIPFAMISMYPEGPRFAEMVVDELRTHEEFRTIRYGVDYCNWGYKLPDLPVYLALARNLYSIVEKDTKGSPIREIPMMKSVRSLQDVGFVLHVSGAGMIGYWLQYVWPEVRFDLACGCTAIMGPEFFPYVQSGQFVGLLEGLAGAAQYEQLVHVPGGGTRGMGSQNLAHLWIICMMILGNIGYLAARRRQRRALQKGK